MTTADGNSCQSEQVPSAAKKVSLPLPCSSSSVNPQLKTIVSPWSLCCAKACNLSPLKLDVTTKNKLQAKLKVRSFPKKLGASLATPHSVHECPHNGYHYDQLCPIFKMSYTWLTPTTKNLVSPLKNYQKWNFLNIHKKNSEWWNHW